MKNEGVHVRFIGGFVPRGILGSKMNGFIEMNFLQKVFHELYAIKPRFLSHIFLGKQAQDYEK